MSAIEALLGPRPGDRPDPLDTTPRTLLVGDDVLIHVQEHENREHVVFYSVPGCVQGVAGLCDATQPGSCVIPHPRHAHARAMLCVDPSTRNVFLAEAWPRWALDRVTFSELLSAHAHRHREWRKLLQRPRQTDPE